MHHGLRAIALAVFAVALGALMHVNAPGSLQSGVRGRDGILPFLDFLRNNPRLVSLESGVNEHDANKGKERSEEDFARLEIGLRVGGHGDQKILAHSVWQTKGGGKCREKIIQQKDTSRSPPKRVFWKVRPVAIVILSEARLLRSVWVCGAKDLI